MLRRRATRRGALVAVILPVSIATGCGNGAHRSGPSPSAVATTIRAVVADIQPAAPSDSARFDRLLKACLKIQRLDAAVRGADRSQLTAHARASLHSGATECTTDPARARETLAGLTYWPRC